MPPRSSVLLASPAPRLQLLPHSILSTPLVFQLGHRAFQHPQFSLVFNLLGHSHDLGLSLTSVDPSILKWLIDGA
jgi:hypothetical protein